MVPNFFERLKDPELNPDEWRDMVIKIMDEFYTDFYRKLERGTRHSWTRRQRLDQILSKLYVRADEVAYRNEAHRLANVMRWIHKFEDILRKEESCLSLT